MMGGKLPDEQYNQTQIGQVLLKGGALRGDNASRRVEEIADAQKSQPAGNRKLLGEMLVDAGLCRKEDVDAGLEVQKKVREGLEAAKMQDGTYPKTDDVDKMIKNGFDKYEADHPGYKRENDKHAEMLEFPKTIEPTYRVMADSIRMEDQSKMGRLFDDALKTTEQAPAKSENIEHKVK